MQSGIEDYGYARRIARLRAYYFEQAPELTAYLLSVPPEERLAVQGLRGGRWQGFLTVSGTVCVITVVLFGSAVGLLTALVAHHSLVAALVTGVAAALAVLALLLRHQRRAWRRANAEPLFVDEVVQLRRDRAA